MLQENFNKYFLLNIIFINPYFFIIIFTIFIFTLELVQNQSI